MKLLHKLLAMLMVLAMIFSLSATAFAAPVDEATIDTSRTGSLDIYKYDLSSAEKDGIWDSSYVSTGVRDEDGVESLLGDPDRISPLNANGNAYGYAVKGVGFTYLKVADIRTYSELEDNASHAEVLYGIAANSANDAFLSALGLSSESRYQPADDDTHGDLIYYYEADVLINGLEAALEANSTTVKNDLETFVRSNGGTAMPLTDEYGHTSAKDLSLGLYLVVETEVPEMVTDTTTPFLVSLPMTSVDGTNTTDGGTRWIYDVTLYPKNLTGIPTLEKTLREDKADTGKNDGSDAVTDGYAHTGTASAGDVIDYQIVSTLPSITSAATYLSEYSFVDTLSKGLTYNKNDVVLEFFKDAACTDKIVSWAEQDGKFTVSYNDLEDGGTSMTITMTAEGLQEINESQTIYYGGIPITIGDGGTADRVPDEGGGGRLLRSLLQQRGVMTAREKRWTYGLWTVTVLWMCLCLYLSWQPGEETAALSGEIAQAVHRVIRLFGVEVDITILHATLRKLAYPAVFFMAGILMCCSTARSLPDGPHRAAIACLISAVAVSVLAVVAEVGKLWILGRHLQWDETLLDVLGAVCGSAAAWAVHRFQRQ